jgi:hypothetical protein
MEVEVQCFNVNIFFKPKPELGIAMMFWQKSAHSERLQQSPPLTLALILM